MMFRTSKPQYDLYSVTQPCGFNLQCKSWFLFQIIKWCLFNFIAVCAYKTYDIWTKYCIQTFTNDISSINLDSNMFASLFKIKCCRLNENSVIAIFDCMTTLTRWIIINQHLQCRHLVLFSRFLTFDSIFIAFPSSEVVLAWSDKNNVENWTKSFPNTSKKATLIQKIVDVVSIGQRSCYIGTRCLLGSTGLH